MVRPGDNEEIQLVAVLRFLKKTQDNVADTLRMRKQRVGLIENWLRTAPLELVEGIIEDYVLKKVVEDQLSVLSEVEPRDIVRAARVVAEDILKYYRTDWQSNRKEQSKHLDAVKETAEVWIRLLERLYYLKDNPILKEFKGIATSVIAWDKREGNPILGGIEAGTEYKYEKQDGVDVYLSNSLWMHYEDEFGKLPFSSWDKLTVKDISPSLLDNMRAIAHGQVLKSSPLCVICKAIRKGHSGR